jgi:undecaprenyl pyrophosphate synthase
MSNANGVSEETHHKMSKKIAQLTKVIFHLHSKNEEHLQFSTSLTNTHEKEMEIILKEANEIISKQKSDLSKAKENNKLAEKIKELEKEHI